MTASATMTLDDDEKALEEQARPFRALYEHWERTQWSVQAIDFSTDAKSFRALDPERQEALIWLFAHRFHAEFSVAHTLAPFLLAAPSYEMQLVLATQVADEYRHMQCVLRVYEEVFGVRGIQAAQRLADEHLDPVAAYFYERFEAVVGALHHDRSEEAFIRAVMAYHLIAEGVVARTAQNLAGGSYSNFGDFPGLLEGQRLVGRDEARHIGIGVSFVRQRMIEAPERTREVIARGLEEYAEITAQGLQMVNADLDATVRRGYGVSGVDFYSEMLRMLEVRLRSVGFLSDDENLDAINKVAGGA
ncbi:MAG TPA: ribonucleotide-diphosphate reductase subunit beta [Thermomicrobiales bacterium]